MLLCLKDYRSGEKGVTAEKQINIGPSAQPARRGLLFAGEQI
jgi:hypothetical protein